MEKMSLKWSCNQRKFMNILASKDEYREKLGYKLSSVWYLHIKSDVYTFDYISNYAFIFYLVRECCTEPTTVTVRYVASESVNFKDLNFSTQNSLFITQIYIKLIKDYRIDMVFIFHPNAKSNDSLMEETPLVEKHNFRRDILTLLDKKHLSDVTLKCGSEVVSAHKAVLCARSPVFEAMFRNRMQEGETNTVTIDDMDIFVFRSWISYVYGGQMKVTSMEFACEVLNVSEKYQMEELKRACVKYLESVLSTENAVKLLEVANLYDEQFKTNVISYIADNLSDLKHSEDWRDLKARKPLLALEVYTYEEEK